MNALKRSFQNVDSDKISVPSAFRHIFLECLAHCSYLLALQNVFPSCSTLHASVLLGPTLTDHIRGVRNLMELLDRVLVGPTILY